MLNEVKKGERDDGQKKIFAEKLINQFEAESTCYYGSARLWDDGIILPSQTRKVLGYLIFI